jgi:hypothetical protein
MYAQVIQGGTTPELRNEMDRIVREEMLPALQEEPGFVRALNLVDRGSGRAMMIVLWDTAENAAVPSGRREPAFLRALAGIAHISTGQREPISLWEVGSDSSAGAPGGTAHQEARSC